MSRHPWLFIAVDPERGLALVRGIDAGRACRLITDKARRSLRGRGWVVPVEHVPDLAAYAQAYHDWVVITTRKVPK